jgi:hypothetical protein
LPLEEPVARGHWRKHDGEEVELALQLTAGSRVTARQLSGLPKLRRG